MNAKVIKARRKRIQDAAPCEGCGSSLASCEANRGKDPTAPPWFGCCAGGLRPLGMCHHVPDQRELNRLLDEIESGEVRPVEDVEEADLLASLEEFPFFSISPRGRSLRRHVMHGEEWPDDVPMLTDRKIY